MSNRTTLAQMSEMGTAAVAALPPDQLAMLLEDVADLKAQAKRYDDILSAALHQRYRDNAKAARDAGEKSHGTVRFEDGDYEVVADLPKKVEWDQKLLRQRADIIHDEWKEDPNDYLEIKLSVKESKFTAWPPHLQQLFTPARTVGAGKPSYELKRKEAA